MFKFANSICKINSYLTITHSIFKFIPSQFRCTIQYSTSYIQYSRLSIQYSSSYIQHSSLEFNIQVWNSIFKSAHSTFKVGILYSSSHIQRSRLEFSIQVYFALSSLSRAGCLGNRIIMETVLGIFCAGLQNQKNSRSLVVVVVGEPKDSKPRRE